MGVPPPGGSSYREWRQFASNFLDILCTLEVSFSQPLLPILRNSKKAQVTVNRINENWELQKWCENGHILKTKNHLSGVRNWSGRCQTFIKDFPQTERHPFVLHLNTTCITTFNYLYVFCSRPMFLTLVQKCTFGSVETVIIWREQRAWLLHRISLKENSSLKVQWARWSPKQNPMIPRCKKSPDHPGLCLAAWRHALRQCSSEKSLLIGQITTLITHRILLNSL